MKASSSRGSEGKSILMQLLSMLFPEAGKGYLPNSYLSIPNDVIGKYYPSSLELDS